MAEQLVPDQVAIFKELFAAIDLDVVSKYKGSITEQTLGTMIIGLTSACLDKAFQKSIIDKDIEVKNAQIALSNAQIALSNAQKAQYESYLKVKQAEFLANIGLGGASGGVDPGGAMMTAVLYAIFSLHEFPEDVKQKIQDYLGGQTP